MRKVLLAVALFAAAAGCSHNAPAAKDPTAVPPLPPSSGTPIGILLDEQSRLNLRDDQVEKLREIDQGLAARNEKLDNDVRESGQPRHDPTTTSNPMMNGGGKRGHRGGGGRGGAGPANHPPPSGPDQATAARAQDERVANVKDALERAFAVLDPAQRTDAEKLLTEHGVDLAPKTAVESEPAGGDGEGGGDEGGGGGEP